MKYYIGVDGGGTKTALVLTTNDGHILNKHIGEATNPADIGVEECANRLEKQLDALLKDFGGRNAEIDSIYAQNSVDSILKLRNSGIPIQSQTVLLKNVNDNPRNIYFQKEFLTIMSNYKNIKQNASVKKLELK